MVSWSYSIPFKYEQSNRFKYFCMRILTGESSAFAVTSSTTKKAHNSHLIGLISLYVVLLARRISEIWRDSNSNRDGIISRKIGHFGQLPNGRLDGNTNCDKCMMKSQLFLNGNPLPSINPKCEMEWLLSSGWIVFLNFFHCFSFLIIFIILIIIIDVSCMCCVCSCFVRMAVIHVAVMWLNWVFGFYRNCVTII